MKKKFEEIKSKVCAFGKKAKNETFQIGSKMVQWGKDNKEYIVASAPIVIAAVRSGQSWVINHRIKRERHRIDHTYYDPSTGMHWELKRKATNNDRAEIIRLKKEGLDTYDILRKMKLIK